MDLYTYVASSNPYQSKAILHKYGYSARDVKDAHDLGICLKKLVTYEGEDALKDILDSHPDKGVIAEMYESQKKTEYKSMDGHREGCNCNCRMREQYMNASGSDSPSKSVQQTSMFILAAALLLAAAIIVKK